MTHDNKPPIDLVHGIYAAFAANDIATVLAAFARDIEWITPPSLPWSAGRYRGHAGVGEYFASFATALSDARLVPERIVDCGGGGVLSLGHEHARVRATGREFTARFAHVWTFADGLVRRMEGIIDTAAIVQAFD
jgi:ketosteroid isomerase-like protein